MSKWKPLSVTQRGLDLLDKVGPVTFSFIALGDGVPTEAGCGRERVRIPVVLIQNKVIRITLDDTAPVSVDFEVKEMAVLAIDPDIGEIVFATSTDSEPILYSNAAYKSGYADEIRISLKSSATESVDVTISNQVVVNYLADAHLQSIDLTTKKRRILYVNDEGHLVFIEGVKWSSDNGFEYDN